MEKEKRVKGSLDVDQTASQTPRLVGYAALFNVETDIGEFRELILPGAFSEAISRSDIHALQEHDSRLVLGRARSGTLVLTEDERGLKVDISPPDTQYARDLLTLIARGDVDQMSFSFSMRGGNDEWNDAGAKPLRTIKKFGEIFDVAVVARGAYPDTAVALRYLAAYRAQRNYSAAAHRVKMKVTLDLKIKENG